MNGAFILIVDDTPGLLDLVRECLEADGYRVATCLQGRNALPLARRIKPDLVMLDVVMPDVSGWDVLAQLSADPELSTLPVIVCTAYMTEALRKLDTLQRLDRARMLGVLPEPFGVDELLELVQSMLDSSPKDESSSGAGPATG